MSDSDIGSTRRIRHGVGHALVVDLPALRVTLMTGPEAGRARTFTLSAIRVGSAADNDLVVVDPSVSRHHAKVLITAEGLAVSDQGSTNGTFVRGLKVRDVVVQPGDVVTFGAVEVKIELRRENLHAVPVEEDRLGALVGQSAAMRELYALVRAVAPASATVLVVGESGTGKELVARAVHELSRRSGPLVTVDCTNTSADLFRSELFGHAKGAFTGAAEARDGAFRRAQRGTVFLDEIGELPLALQSSLLRVLETREVQPVGADRTIPVDARLVAATNVDLSAAVARGAFRADLYHRLSVIRVAIPPLRERAEDLPLLVAHLVESLGVTARFGAAALTALAARRWPGNVRELRNAVERLGLVAAAREVRAEEIGGDELSGMANPPSFPGSPVSAPGAPDEAGGAGGAPLDAVERAAIERELAATGGNRAEAARRLGISLSTLKRRLRDYRLGDA